MDNINKYSLTLITRWEGCSLSAYEDSVGVWTIGYGHTLGVAEYLEIAPYQAIWWIKSELVKYAKGVTDALPNVTLMPYEYGALTSLCYNIGIDAFANSTLCKKINYDKTMYKDIAKEWLEFDLAGGTYINGLEKRRINEVDCYTNGDLWELSNTYHLKDKLGKIITSWEDK